MPTQPTQNLHRYRTQRHEPKVFLMVLRGDCDRPSDCLAEEVNEVRIVNVELRI
jgi:hypothetical protein